MDTNTPLSEKKKRKKPPLLRIASNIDDALLAEKSRTWHGFYLRRQAELEAGLNSEPFYICCISTIHIA